MISLFSSEFKPGFAKGDSWLKYRSDLLKDPDSIAPVCLRSLHLQTVSRPKPLRRGLCLASPKSEPWEGLQRHLLGEDA